MLLDSLVARAARLADGRRAILGIAGSPGAGKSTLARTLVDQLDPLGDWVALVPMDGFHLANATLSRRGRRDRKGAIDTFDAHGYLAVLRRFRAEVDRTVFAPDYDRLLEEPVAGSIPVHPGVRLIVTEGNYLLSELAPWPEIRAEIDEVWFVDADDRARRERLVARHVRFGKSEGEARRWVAEVDEANARQIELGRSSADLVIDSLILEAEAPAR